MGEVIIRSQHGRIVHIVLPVMFLFCPVTCQMHYVDFPLLMSILSIFLFVFLFFLSLSSFFL